MPQTYPSTPGIQPRLVCRPALPMDTAAVMELTKNVWGGHDYVPYVWADWLADPAGLLAVVELGGVVVGLGKLSALGEGEWWLEGLRTHPDYEGQGIASHLYDYIMGVWEQTGGQVVRLVTASFRVKVHHLCQRGGFVKLGEYINLSAPVLTGEAHRFTPLAEADCTEALAFALQCETTTLVHGLMDLGWRYGRLSAARLAEAARRGRAWWWQGRRGLLTFWLDDDEEGVFYPIIELLACDRDDLAQCLHDFRRLAAASGYGKTAWAAPLHPGLEAVYLSAGFQRQWEHEIWLYEKYSSSALHS